MQFEYFKKGEGQPLLFLCGANATTRLYLPLLILLASKYKVYSFNYPCFGKTDKLKKDHTLDFYISVVDKFAKKVRLDKFHLAGHSFGGFLALKYAQKYPAKVQSIVLFSPLTKRRFPFIFYPLCFLGNEIQKTLSPSRVLTRSIELIDNLKNISYILKHSLFVLRLRAGEEDLPSDIPILVIIGENDLLNDSNYTLKLFSDSDNARITLLRKHGHAGFASIGNRLLEIVGGFTQSLSK